MKKPWIRPRYYCTNTGGGCRHATSDTPFSAADFARDGGRCPGYDGQVCGQPLKPGDPQDLRPRWIAVGIAGMLVSGAAGFCVRVLLFPPPIEHVAFATTETEATDNAGLLAIEVVRDADVNSRLAVDYLVADGTARAGQDYTAARGQLVFGPGERRKTVSIGVLPDLSFQKERRHFTVSLPNVMGEPRHVVHIAPRAVARTDRLVAEQSVRNASVMAKEIADSVVRQGVLDELLAASRAKPGEFGEYRQSLAIVNGNLTRARESYVQMLRDLQAMQPAIVLGAMDQVAEDLARKGFAQQGQAVAIMKRQFTELLNHRGADMDRWAKELSQVVPRVPGGVRTQPST